MSCYVDAFNPNASSKRWRYRGACHLACDTSAELDAAARCLQLRPEWKQDTGKPTEHFDLTRGMRETALTRCGAREVNRAGFVAIITRKRGNQERSIR